MQDLEIEDPKRTATCDEQDQETAKTDAIDESLSERTHSYEGLEVENIWNVFNQDKVNDKYTWISFVEMATSSLDKLEDNKASHSLRISDFKEITSNKYVNVGIFTVPESLESYAKDLLATHADIGTRNSPVHYVNEMAFVVLCCVLKSRDTTCFSEVFDYLILKWRDASGGAFEFGFKIDFLKDRLKSITQAYLGRLARDSQKNKELHAIDDMITTMKKELDTLKARAKIYNNIYSEQRTTCHYY